MNTDMDRRNKVLANQIQEYLKIILHNQVDFILKISDCEFPAQYRTSTSVLFPKIQGTPPKEAEEQV